MGITKVKLVIQKEGIWILREVCGSHTERFHRSVCDKSPEFGNISKYCPNCGAKMIGYEH